MKLPKIVGIAGTNGAGKDELGRLLAERRGYHFHSVTDLLRAELSRQGKEINRENLAALSKQWRNETGDDGVMFTKAIQAYMAEKDEKGYGGVALASIRHPGEVTAVQNFGGVVVWVDADQQTRYDRVTGNSRGRMEDHVTFEQFKADEDREMYPPADAPAGTLNMAAVRDVADIKITNDFSSVDEYRDYLIKEFDL
jgi:dephospho-CoA kinase